MQADRRESAGEDAVGIQPSERNHVDQHELLSFTSTRPSAQYSVSMPKNSAGRPRHSGPASASSAGISSAAHQLSAPLANDADASPGMTAVGGRSSRSLNRWTLDAQRPKARKRRSGSRRWRGHPICGDSSSRKSIKGVHPLVQAQRLRVDLQARQARRELALDRRRPRQLRAQPRWQVDVDRVPRVAPTSEVDAALRRSHYRARRAPRRPRFARAPED